MQKQETLDSAGVRGISVSKEPNLTAVAIPPEWPTGGQKEAAAAAVRRAEAAAATAETAAAAASVYSICLCWFLAGWICILEEGKEGSI